MDTAGIVLGRQLTRSGTGVGANVEEAQAAQTRREFIRKMVIAQGEARETLYWLRLINESGLVPGERLCELRAEADEITRVLSKIAVNARKSDEHRK